MQTRADFQKENRTEWIPRHCCRGNPGCSYPGGNPWTSPRLGISYLAPTGSAFAASLAANPASSFANILSRLNDVGFCLGGYLR
jgi:hypothetical protein